MNEQQTIDILASLKLHAMADVYRTSLRFSPTNAPPAAELIAEMAEAEQSAARVRRTNRLLKAARLRFQDGPEAFDLSPERNLDRQTLTGSPRSNGSNAVPRCSFPVPPAWVRAFLPARWAGKPACGASAHAMPRLPSCSRLCRPLVEKESTSSTSSESEKRLCGYLMTSS